MQRKIHIYKQRADLIEAVTNKIINTIVQENGICNIALAGGNTPRDVYAFMATHYKDRVDWNRVHLFWGDERAVPPDHPDSNFGMVQKTLLTHITILEANVHRIRGEIAAKEAAAEYTALLNKHFEETPPRFNFILLGVGEDGHTASLFPGTEALVEANHPVVAVFVPKFNTWRLTLTFPVLNAASEVVFLVAGNSKSEIVKKVLGVKQATKELPATLVWPKNGILHWMLDYEAAKLINKEVHLLLQNQNSFGN